MTRSACALAFCALLAAQAAAQTGGNTQSSDTIIDGQRSPRWAGQVTALTSNALLGGLTAGIDQELRGGSFKDGFARGALGEASRTSGSVSLPPNGMAPALSAGKSARWAH